MQELSEAAQLIADRFLVVPVFDVFIVDDVVVDANVNAGDIIVMLCVFVVVDVVVVLDIVFVIVFIVVVVLQFFVVVAVFAAVFCNWLFC